MENSSLVALWSQYLSATPEDKASVAYEVSQTLGNHGNEIEQRAFLMRALEVGLEFGDVRSATQAAISLASIRSDMNEFKDAEESLAILINGLNPWHHFELGLAFRELAWIHKRSGEVIETEKYLKSAIEMFRAENLIAWYFPLENELASALIERGALSEAIDLVNSKYTDTENLVSPIAVALRFSIHARISREMKDYKVALNQILISASELKKLQSALHEEILQEAVEIACLSPTDFLEIANELPTSLKYDYQDLEKISKVIFEKVYLF
jgi:tetratricopeptide (TPR) repeat protein